VKEKWPDVRILYMSGYSEDAAASPIGPGDCFIQKPFSPAGLATAVQRALIGGEAR
jgi:hypothetical protein